MNTDRNKYLTEAMGECWHEFLHSSDCHCDKCGQSAGRCHNRSYSDWMGFGKLWTWAQEQEWWSDFVDTTGGYYSEYIKRFTIKLINPDRFADAVYESLKGREDK